MLASISLIRVSTTGFRGKKYWSPQSTFLNAQEARAAALGGCLAQLRRPCCAVFAVLLHSHVTFRVTGSGAGCAGTEDNPQPRCTQAQQIRDLTWTEICTELWYFPPTLYQHKDDRDQKQVVQTLGGLQLRHPVELTPHQPWLNIFLLFQPEQRATEAETELSARQARRVRGGQRSHRWTQASTGSPPRGQCGEGGAWHRPSPIRPFHSQDTRVCKAPFQRCNLD